jgi:hypothetical protein
MVLSSHLTVEQIGAFMAELRFRFTPFGSVRPNQQFDSAMPDRQDDTVIAGGCS